MIVTSLRRGDRLNVVMLSQVVLVVLSVRVRLLLVLITAYIYRLELVGILLISQSLSTILMKGGPHTNVISSPPSIDILTI